MLTVENKENSSKEDSPSDNTSEKTATRPVSMSTTTNTASTANSAGTASTALANAAKVSTTAAAVIPTKEDYTSRYWESTQETLVGIYGNRDPLTGKPS